MRRPIRFWPRDFRGKWEQGGRSTRMATGGRLCLAALLGVGLALLAIRFFDTTLQPTAAALAETKAKNAVTLIITDAVSKTLSSVSYDEIVSLQKDGAGRITAMTTSSTKMNALRASLLEDITEQVETLDTENLGIPLGNLTGFVSFSGRGPMLPVRIMSVGSSDAVFSNVFTSAGINQTLHQIMLDVTVTVKLLLPGGVVETPVSAQVRVCETVIVGDVPEAYLQFGS